MKAGLTNQQKLYLLEIAESNDKMTISSMARSFKCSKVNSKYILDKMVEIGVLKKERNIFVLSKRGEVLAEDYLAKEYALEHLLQESYALSTKDTKDYARCLINLPQERFLDVVKEKSQLLDRFQEVDQVSVESFLNQMPKGTYPIQYGLYSLEGKDQVGLEHALRDKAQVLISDNRGRVDFFYKPNAQACKVYFKKEGLRTPLKRDSQGFQLPLKALESLKSIRYGLLQGTVVLDVECPEGEETTSEEVLLVLTFKIYSLANE